MILRWPLVPILWASSLAAQGQVWVVDDTAATMPDFTDLQIAIDTAASGDILLVRSGTYPEMAIDAKCLTIQAEAGASVTIQDPDTTWTFADTGPRVKNLSSDQSVHLRGLTITARGQGLLLDSNAGLVWIEECSITCPAPLLGFFNSCHGAMAGLFARDCSDIVLVRTQMQGRKGNGSQLFDPGGCFGCNEGSSVAGAGLLVESSNVHAFGCTFIGGGGRGWDGGLCEFQAQKGGHGIRGSGNPPPFLFLSDCTVQAGDGLGCVFDESCAEQENHGGDGLFWAGPAAVLDSSFQAGTKGSCMFGYGGTDGVRIAPDPNLVLEKISGPAVRMRVNSPVRESGTVELEFEGPPNLPIWLLTSSSPRASFQPDLRATLLVGTPSTTSFLGFTDASGHLLRTLTFSPLPAGVEGRVFFTQALMRRPQQGKLSLFPTRFIGEGSMLVGLDQAF